ncbi:unnamed protein product [Adineta steineri]|uniref:LIM zinc-binding domain-containing protein n=1 Tax=Adineta steineri TaxID=433720 RepID=A0A814NYG1_9BILA|nr:unnamed protein product [Adineta steineri]CAF1152913.1 unnamed protein product [Adineta steineri]CAF1254400.1 unnamed protein product [Adineta steineri]
MNLDRYSPSTITARVIAPRPFYRSQITPDPYDYSNNNQQYHPTLQRVYSSSNINGSSLSNSYLSDHEQSPPIISMYPRHHQQYRSANNNKRDLMLTKKKYLSSLALISVSSSQSPLITIASGGSTNRSQIRVSSSSLPKTNKSTLHEIHISRPDSPTISINRTGTNQPITFTSTPNGGLITNGNGSAFHISVGTPTNSVQHDIRGQTPPAKLFHQIDKRYTLNPTTNRFKPLIVYTTPKTNTFDRSSPIVNLPPASNSTSLSMRNGNIIKRDHYNVDQLTKFFIKNMNTTNEANVFGMCARCNDEIIGEENGLVAMDRMYHVPCFTCTMCGCRLRGMHFYSMENQPYCEPCYISSLEKCVVCALPITDRILRATGKPYHAQCFCCVVCQKSLDGIPFTVDATIQIHCIDCFHQKFAPRCYACHRPILPVSGEEETVRIVAFDRSYHFDCYRCENCKIQFTSEQGCYPIDDHIFCLQCNQTYSSL